MQHSILNILHIQISCEEFVGKNIILFAFQDQYYSIKTFHWKIFKHRIVNKLFFFLIYFSTCETCNMLNDSYHFQNGGVHINCKEHFQEKKNGAHIGRRIIIFVLFMRHAVLRHLLLLLFVIKYKYRSHIWKTKAKKGMERDICRIGLIKVFVI